MLTKATPVYWVAEAKCERWLKFLNEVFPGRPEMVAFLKRAVGYSLTGLTREEVFFILYGLGRNGKGTFLRVLSAVLGEYAANRIQSSRRSLPIATTPGDRATISHRLPVGGSLPLRSRARVLNLTKP